MSDILSFVGKYVGREQAAENRDKLKLEVDGRTLTFAMFKPWKNKDGSERKGIHPDTMVMGKIYKISYNEYHGVLKAGQDKGKAYVSKTALCVFEADLKDATNVPTQAGQPAPAVATDPFAIAPDTLDKLAGAYFSKVPVEKQELNHFIGVVFRSINEVKCKTIEEVFNKNKK